jgi:hypothetical protein
MTSCMQLKLNSKSIELIKHPWVGALGTTQGIPCVVLIKWYLRPFSFKCFYNYKFFFHVYTLHAKVYGLQCSLEWLYMDICRNPTFGKVWRWHSHSRNGDLGVLQYSWNIPMNTLPWSVLHVIEKLLKCRCQNDLAWTIWTFVAQVMAKKRSGIKLAVWLSTTKIWESTQPQCVQVECNTSLEALKESYKFVSDLIPIGGLSKKLWIHKVPGVQTKIVSGLLLGSPRTKSHSDVGAAK